MGGIEAGGGLRRDREYAVEHIGMDVEVELEAVAIGSRGANLRYINAMLPGQREKPPEKDYRHWQPLLT